MTEISQLYERAQLYLAGGVCATARANAAIGHPMYVARGDGSRIYDVEGREYVDMCMSHGASLLGHNHLRIKAAVAKDLDLGIICSYETEHHVALARRVTELVPCVELVRFAGSGTETVMHALRLARSANGRDKIIKFEGHFHGYADALNFSAAPPLDQAGPADAPRAYPESSGVPASARGDIVIIPFNDGAALEGAFAAHGRDATALILEPINYDQGCILPKPGFLQRCREWCDRHGVVLIFDEVTNYRQAALKDRALEHAFIAGCYRRGVYFAVSPHHGFSAAHTEADMDRVLAAIAGAMEDIQMKRRTHPAAL